MAIKRFKDICTKIGSGATPHGGKGAYVDSGISLIRSQNVLDFSFSYDGLAYINEEQAARLNNVIVQPGDILLNITGDSVARVCMVDQNALPARVNQHVAIIRPDPKIAYGDFILYYLQMIKPYLLQLASGGATRNALTKGMIEELEIDLPTIKTQKKRAGILRALDDKIELNNRINENLTEQDLSLVISIAESSNINLTLKDICSSIYAGGTPSRKNSSFWDKPTITWYKNGEVKNNILIDSEEHISDLALLGSSAKIVPPHSILFAMYCVSTPQLAINAYECTTNQAVCSLVIEDFQMMSYVYYYLMHYGITLTNLANGAAQQNLNKGMIEAFSIKVPNNPNALLSILASHIQMKINLEKENVRLMQLRDTLLPKLMSGELDVSEIDL